MNRFVVVILFLAGCASAYKLGFNHGKFVMWRDIREGVLGALQNIEKESGSHNIESRKN